MRLGLRGSRPSESESFLDPLWIWKDPVLGRSVRLGLFLLLFLLVLTLAFFWRLPPELPFLYSRPWGGAQLIPTTFFFPLYFLLLLVILFDSVLASSLKSERLLARILIITSALAVFLVAVAVIRVFLLVT